MKFNYSKVMHHNPTSAQLTPSLVFPYRPLLHDLPFIQKAKTDPGGRKLHSSTSHLVVINTPSSLEPIMSQKHHNNTAASPTPKCCTRLTRTTPDPIMWVILQPRWSLCNSLTCAEWKDQVAKVILPLFHFRQRLVLYCIELIDKICGWVHT